MPHDPYGSGIDLPLTRLANLRDLGGIPVRRGVIRSGLLWRSDDISFTTSEQIEELIAGGLTTVIDLRSPQEASFTGRGPLQATAVEYHHLPLTDQLALPEALAAAMLRGATAEEVGRWYADMAFERSVEISRALTIFAEARGATLFHCSAGKDRTGVLAAAVLTVLGADRAAIVADYARTDDTLGATRARLRPVVAGLLHRGGETAATAPEPRPETAPEQSRPTLGAQPESMAAMLSELDARGGLLAALDAAGLAGRVTRRLHDRLVDAGSAPPGATS